MGLIRELGQELFKMFMADSRLTLAVLLLVALIAAALRWGVFEPSQAGVALLIGCLVILWTAVEREASRR